MRTLILLLSRFPDNTFVYIIVSPANDDDSLDDPDF